MKINRTSEKIIAFKWPIIAAVTLITLLLGYQIKNMSIDADVLGSLPESDPDAVLMKQIGRNFGGNRMGIVILETDNIYKTEVIRHVRVITDTIERIDGISSVSSLSNIINIKGGDSGIQVGQLVDEYSLPESDEDFGMTTHCNSWGPFTATDVQPGGAGCSDIYPPILQSAQLLLNQLRRISIIPEIRGQRLPLKLPPPFFFSG